MSLFDAALARAIRAANARGLQAARWLMSTHPPIVVGGVRYCGGRHAELRTAWPCPEWREARRRVLEQVALLRS